MESKPKIIRLPRNGPRPNQTTEQWLRGKAQADRGWAQASPKATTDRRLINPKLRDR